MASTYIAAGIGGLMQGVGQGIALQGQARAQQRRDDALALREEKLLRLRAEFDRESDDRQYARQRGLAREDRQWRAEQAELQSEREGGRLADTVTGADGRMYGVTRAGGRVDLGIDAPKPASGDGGYGRAYDAALKRHTDDALGETDWVAVAEELQSVGYQPDQITRRKATEQQQAASAPAEATERPGFFERAGDYLFGNDAEGDPQPDTRTAGADINERGGPYADGQGPNAGRQSQTQPARQPDASDDLPRPKTPEEAERLPPGARFMTPDGKIRVVPERQGQSGSVGQADAPLEPPGQGLPQTVLDRNATAALEQGEQLRQQQETEAAARRAQQEAETTARRQRIITDAAADARALIAEGVDPRAAVDDAIRVALERGDGLVTETRLRMELNKLLREEAAADQRQGNRAN